MKKLSARFTAKGFTLIELLIVIAVLGILSTILFVAINPIQQFARARDAGRKSTVDQLVKAMQAYYTSHSGVYPNASATWVTTNLQATGELQIAPAAVTYSAGGAACSISSTTIRGTENGWCYVTDSTTSNGTVAAIYTRMESQSEGSKCAAGTNAYFLWSSADGKAGIVCSAADPTTSSGFTYLQ